MANLFYSRNFVPFYPLHQFPATLSSVAPNFKNRKDPSKDEVPCPKSRRWLVEEIRSEQELVLYSLTHSLVDFLFTKSSVVLNISAHAAMFSFYVIFGENTSHLERGIIISCLYLYFLIEISRFL